MKNHSNKGIGDLPVVRLRPARFIFLAVLLLLFFFSALALAETQDDVLYDVYRLSSEASADVDNDLMVATLIVQEEDKDASALANKVNSAMSWAVNVLRPYNSIMVKTRDYQTYPRYDNSSARRIIGWRASQSIELETDDFTAAGKAIQQLQERLKVQSINLSVKSETRDTASDKLIEKALDAFKNRARLVQRNMNSTSFRILDVDVRSQQSQPAYANDRMMRQTSMESSSMVESEPAIVAGTTTVYVRIEGRIQLEGRI